MGEINDKFADTYRDNVTAGVPASGPHDPAKRDIRALAVPIEAGIAAAALSGTDLDAAMQLVQPLADSAEAAKEAAEDAAEASQALVDALPAEVAGQLGQAVATATAASAASATQSAASAALANQKLAQTDALFTNAGEAIPIIVPGSNAVGAQTSDAATTWAITDDDFLHPRIDQMRGDIAAVNGGAGAYPELRVTGEIVGVPIYGASHSRGFAANPVISTTPSASSLMFAGGVRPDDAGTDATAQFGSLVALVEQTKGDLGETLASGMSEMIAQLLAAEGKNAATANQRLLFSSSGEPGTPLSTLADETSSFAVRFKAAIANGRTRAAALGKVYAPLFSPFPAGSTDYGNGVGSDGWKADVRKWLRWAEREAQRASGLFDRPFATIIAQQTTHPWYGRVVPNIAIAQLELAQQDRYIGVLTAGGVIPTGSDNLHFTARGEKWLGALYGFYAYWWFWRGVKIKPLVPVVTQQGNSLILRFPVRPGRKLVVDTTTLAALPNWGVTAADTAGTAVTLSNPRLSGNDTVIVDAASLLAPGAKVRMAWTGTAYNGQTNIRDDEPTVFDPTGLALPIWQWAPICEVTL